MAVRASVKLWTLAGVAIELVKTAAVVYTSAGKQRHIFISCAFKPTFIRCRLFPE